jgi:hypothetical protein
VTVLEASCEHVLLTEAVIQEDIMTSSRMLMSAIIAAGILLGVQSAEAHCDSLDGPVAKAVYKALDDGNVNPVLA